MELAQLGLGLGPDIQRNANLAARGLWADGFLPIGLALELELPSGEAALVALPEDGSGIG